MSILLEFIPSLFAALAFDFVLYITGVGVLKTVSFGALKYQLPNYSQFKELKGNRNEGYLLPYIVGILFYALIIVAIAWFN